MFYCERISQVVNVAVIGMMVLKRRLVVSRWPQKEKTCVGERHVGDSKLSGSRAAFSDFRCNFSCCVQNCRYERIEQFFGDMPADRKIAVIYNCPEFVGIQFVFNCQIKLKKKLNFRFILRQKSNSLNHLKQFLKKCIQSSIADCFVCKLSGSKKV